MYLKNIEIQGFKSFAKKINFEFPNGITGIVGPNGSGKSNVADAVRWVLGEQRIKQLRGSRMEDVIFAGTENRKPLSYASVSLTLDNSDHKLKLDYDEVTVSRKVYRSGESEYLLNGSPCRLKDINELFYDTGIGKEGYSIIGQGQIDKILQGKPEERRELFDEAAGIVKYKKRKTIALRKLENERLNLSRVTDILNELEHRVGPLKRQSEAADKFIKLKEELKIYDLNLFLIENGDLKDKIKELEEREKITADELAESRIVYEQAKEEYEKLSEDITELDGFISDLKNQIAQCDIVKENLNGQINVINEQINSANEAESHFADRVNSLTEAIFSAKAAREETESKKEENKTALEDALKAVTEGEEALGQIRQKSREASEKSESLKEKVIALINAKGEISGRMERLGALMEQMEARKAELAGSIEKFAGDKKAQEAKVALLTEEYEAAKGEADNFAKDVADAERSLKEATDEEAGLNKEILSGKEQLIKYAAQLENIRNITERYEGYGSSIKEVMKLKESDKGIVGVVADIIKTDKKYETAVETALGGNIQNIITDTEGTAKDAIEYLKKNKLGRATFLPLKAVTGRGEFTNSDVLSEKGVIGTASSLVNAEEKYKGVVNYLLGKIICCDNINNALAVARKYNYSLIIVTLEGELLNRGGAMSGGAFKNKSNLLGRRREIDDLEAAIKSLKSKNDSAARKLEVIAKEKEALTKELTELRTQQQENRILLNTLTLNLEQAKARKDELTASYENVDSESRKIELQTGEVTDENASLAGELETNARESDDLKAEILELSAALEEYKKLEAEKLENVQLLRDDHTRLTEQKVFLEERIASLSQELNGFEKELEDLKNSGTDTAKLVESRKEEIADIERAIAEADKKRIDLAAELSTLENKKDEQTGSHRDFITKREDYAEHVSNLDKELFRLTQAREKLEERFESKSSYIWDEYELTYNSALAFRDESLDSAKDMSQHIGELKNAIRSLGSINVAAIDEYKEVKERYEFLQTQHTDLLKAEEDLLKIIKDLDKEMRRQFNSEFKKIQAEFGKVFKEMFGGGTGTIELEEDVDVLDAGITIIAQPPGKNLQNIMPLSGGEKAHTATA